MDIHHHVAMLNILLEDATQHLHAVQDARAATAWTTDTTYPGEAQARSTEQALWEQACRYLRKTRTVFTDLQESARQRGVRQRGSDPPM